MSAWADACRDRLARLRRKDIAQLTDLLIEQNSYASRMKVSELAQVINHRVHDDPEVTFLVVL